jgi:hypothetical protein
VWFAFIFDHYCFCFAKTELASALIDELNTHPKVQHIRRKFAMSGFVVSVLVYCIFLVIGTIVAFGASTGFNSDRFLVRDAVSGMLVAQVPDGATYARVSFTLFLPPFVSFGFKLLIALSMFCFLNLLT